MIGPICGDVVSLVVPQRESVGARVEETGEGWYSLELLQQLQTQTSVLTRRTVYVQFAGAEGIGRMRGSVERDDFDCLRFTRRGEVQLLARAEAVRAQISAPIALIDGDRVTHDARTVELSAAGLMFDRLAGALPGEAYDFRLHLLAGQPPLAGRLRVATVAPSGAVRATFTTLGNDERATLLGIVASQPHGKAA